MDYWIFRHVKPLSRTLDTMTRHLEIIGDTLLLTLIKVQKLYLNPLPHPLHRPRLPLNPVLHFELYYLDDLDLVHTNLLRLRIGALLQTQPPFNTTIDEDHFLKLIRIRRRIQS